MKLLLVASGFVLACSLHAQSYGPKVKDFTESCFRNPALPYCKTRDFVTKPGAKGATNTYGTAATGSPTVDAAGIDWRFADPSADSLAVLDCAQLSTSPLAKSIFGELSSTQGLTPAQAQDLLRALSSVSKVALSIHQDSVLVMVTGRPSDAVLPALEAGWKAVPLGASALLIGRSAAVDEASKRLTLDTELGDFPLAAQHRPAEAGFWMVASAKLAGQEAIAAGAKQFELTALLADPVSTVTAFHFDSAPDPASIRPWLNTLGGTSVQGDVVRARVYIDAPALQENSAHIAATPLGVGLSAVIRSARYLPVRDTAATVHTKPVIYGLDDGPREVK